MNRIARILLQRGLGLSAGAAALFVGLVAQYRRAMVISFVASLVAALTEGFTLAFLALALEVLGAGTMSATASRAVELGASLGLDHDGSFLLLVGCAIAMQVLHSLLTFVSDVAHASLQSNVERTARQRIFDRFMSTSYGEARSRRVGELSSYMDQVNFLGLALQRVHMISSQLLLLVVYMSLLLWFSWVATLTTIGAMLVLTFLIRRLVRRVRREAIEFKTTLVNVNSQTIEFLSGLRVIFSFGRERYAKERVGVAIDRCAQARKRGLIWQASIAPVIESISILVIGGVLVAGFAIYGSSDRAKLIELASFVLVIFRSAPRLSMLNKSWGQMTHYLTFFERASEILGAEDGKPRGDTARFDALRDRIEFSHVTLVYPGTETAAVHDLQFELRRGQMLALVGESGAGKTTIADLLLGLYRPTSGAILVDGVPLDRLDWDDWRARLGVVNQDTFLLDGTIRENIAFGKLDATDEEIEAAARVAHAHDFISQLDTGYDTRLGEQGYRLSGGQRQRLAIARAVLRDPQILILDEATSDLDSQSEALIQESMMRLRENRTVLVIAHRLSTIAAADEILVLGDGRVLERGRHHELLSENGMYANFVNLQSKLSFRAPASGDPT